MKRLSSFTAVLLAVVIFLSSTVFTSAEQLSATSTGFSNVAFSNGYNGFCIDASLSGAYSGDGFSVANSTSAAKHNTESTDVSHLLKAMFTQCFETMFVSDGNGGFVIDSFKADSSIQSAIWNITDSRYVWGESKTFVDTAKAYSGPEIPDSGYTKQLANGDVITFYFKVFEPFNNGQQSFFAYKIEVNSEPEHEHSYGTDWKSDGTNHWHECSCGEKQNIEKHSGNTADCTTPSTCDKCERQLAEKDSKNHTGGTVKKNEKPAKDFENGYTGDTYCLGCDTLLEQGETIPATHEHSYGTAWESDGTNHWHECSCGEKQNVEKHSGNTANCTTPSTCDKCERQLAEKDSKNHTGGTVVKNEKPAKEFENGYTGDTYCLGCDTLLEQGETIPATHKHSYGTVWESDGTNHWHECSCGEKQNVEKHSGNIANCTTPSTCDKCERQLAEKNPDNHTGGTDIKNAKPAGEFEEGYSGDIYCLSCDTLLELGSIIEANHKHAYGTEWESDDTNHWHECECKDRKDEAQHSFTNGECSVCGEADKNYDNTPDTEPDTKPDSGKEPESKPDSKPNGSGAGTLVGGIGSNTGSENVTTTKPNTNTSTGNGNSSNNNSSTNNSNQQTTTNGTNNNTSADNNTGDKPNADVGENDSENQTAKPDNGTFSPDTGRDSSVGLALACLLAGLGVLVIVVSRKKEELAAV